MTKPLTNTQELSAYLTNLRTSHGYTQKEVASYLHITPSAYANYESHRRSLTPDSLLKLSELYHRSADDLLREASSHYHTGYQKNTQP